MSVLAQVILQSHLLTVSSSFRGFAFEFLFILIMTLLAHRHHRMMAKSCNIESKNSVISVPQCFRYRGWPPVRCFFDLVRQGSKKHYKSVGSVANAGWFLSVQFPICRGWFLWSSTAPAAGVQFFHTARNYLNAIVNWTTTRKPVMAPGMPIGLLLFFLVVNILGFIFAVVIFRYFLRHLKRLAAKPICQRHRFAITLVICFGDVPCVVKTVGGLAG
ncbi:hypothetical protein Q31a_41200 [Aureliella helgolandensis]|uniref:Uncharacterized protein n=1 Tax=Aureliella helgolandensis TaxID=2527968 RepID=A0A518GB45_9BACT|nr:hypothetical protein Q31a_41200 [Aureliella helgolandensis]